MGILTWIVLGLIAGAVTRAATPGRARGGFLIPAVVAVCGAFLGGYVGGAITSVGLTGVSLWSILLAVFGSLLFLGAYRVAYRVATRSRTA
jgi:uncharacterized membrane protein YeaQ/YmgE (transglycosylase-associated protein family)